MNLQSEIQERLWIAIATTYQADNYTGAILDAITLLMDIIRDKSGLRADGASLIGQAFGGASPIIKVNRLQTESEKDEQRGLESLLRGLYTAVRNPRSHEKKTDKKEFADSLICFIDRLITWIDEARSPFDIGELLAKVFDPLFVSSDQYAELLVQEVPPGKRLDLLIQLFQRRREGDTTNVVLFSDALWKLLTPEELIQYREILSDSLFNMKGSENWFSAIQMSISHWEHLKPLAKARAEGHLIASIRAGRYSKDDDACNDQGKLGTWASGLGAKFLLKEQLLDEFESKLDSADPDNRAYILKYFLRDLIEAAPTPEFGLKYTLLGLLRRGDQSAYDALRGVVFGDEVEGWRKVFLQPLRECPLYQQLDEEIPF